jgi:hypothetical protein
MGHYTKLAVLLMRSFGLIILLYAVPIVIWGLARLAFGGTMTSDGMNSFSAFVAWSIYALAGVALLRLARPLARIAARGLDPASTE